MSTGSLGKRKIDEAFVSREGRGALALEEDLLPETLFAIWGFLYYDELVRLSWCSKKLNGMMESKIIEEKTKMVPILLVCLRRANEFHKEKESNPTEGLKEMQAMTAAEATRGFCPWAQAMERAKHTIESTPYVPELDEDDPDYPIYSGEVSLCYGFAVDFDVLWNWIYPGRRWYTDQKLFQDGSMNLLSQPLTEPPYKGHEKYTEIDADQSKDDLTDEIWFGDELPYGDSRRESKTRPPGLKAWKGPYLKHHAPEALADYSYRSGIDSNIIKHLSIHFTGGAEGGPLVVVGIRIGKKMQAEYFDVFRATGTRLFAAGRRFATRAGLVQERFGYEIRRASEYYSATTMGFSNDSVPFLTSIRAMGCIETLKQGIGNDRTSDVAFHFICNSW